MVRDTASSDAPPAEPGWEIIQVALEEIARLALSATTSHEFHAALVDRTVRALSAAGGAVWLRSAADEWTLDAEHNRAAAGWENDEAAHQQLLDAALSLGAPAVAAPGKGPVSHPQAVNRSELTVVLAPLRRAAVTLGVLELLVRGPISLAVQRGYVQFLAAACELATDFYRQQQLREFADRERQWRQLDEFAERVHGSLDVRETAYAIANDGRRLIGCDRVSVAVCRARGCRITAVSGVEQLQRRSNMVRRLEQLCKAVAQTDEAVWYPVARETLPPKLEQTIDACLDESQARVLVAIPLRAAADERQPGRPSGVVGVLVVEQFHSGAVDGALRGRIEATGRHASTALAGALELQSLPLLPVNRGLRRVARLFGLRQFPKTLAVVGLLAGAIAALFWVPAEFRLEARGELQPAVRREVFAPNDGVVSEVRVAAGDQVHAGDVLIRLRKPQLEFELERVLGEMQTARKRLSAVQAARISPDRGQPDAVERYQQRSADEEEIKALIGSLEEQERILRAEQGELVVTSPIDGQVLTWDLQQLLETRPVQRGQVLLSVGDLAGPWQLELRLPDNHAGYLLDAQQALTPHLDVQYLLATDPGKIYDGRVQRVALAAETDEVYGSHVRVTVDVDRDRLSQLRPGATVSGRIDCGRRPIGFVWFHDLISAVRTRILF